RRILGVTVQQTKGFVFLVYGGVDSGHKIRRYIRLRGEFLQLLQYLLRLVPIPSLSIHHPEDREVIGSALRHLYRLSTGGDGSLRHRLVRVCKPKDGLRLGKARIQFERLLKLLDGLIVSAREEKDESQSLVHYGVRIQANGAFELGVALLVTSHHGEIEPEPLMRCRV